MIKSTPIRLVTEEQIAQAKEYLQFINKAKNIEFTKRRNDAEDRAYARRVDQE
jgi:hypothetical protein